MGEQRSLMSRMPLVTSIDTQMHNLLTVDGDATSERIQTQDKLVGLCCYCHHVILLSSKRHGSKRAAPYKSLLFRGVGMTTRERGQ